MPVRGKGPHLVLVGLQAGGASLESVEQTSERSKQFSKAAPDKCGRFTTVISALGHRGSRITIILMPTWAIV